jgi:5-methylcytosine-specific restriction enzyme A
VNALPAAAEGDFQEAANALSRKVGKPTGYEDPPPGPVPLPKKTQRPGGAGYNRDPKVSSAAIEKAKYLCGIDSAHRTFVSRTTRQNFVEAHHLVPMQFQSEFNASLDVVENVVVLCPNCHRMLHHGVFRGKCEALRILHAMRSSLLGGRGIQVTIDQLLTFYRTDLEEG